MTKREATRIVRNVCLGQQNILYTDHGNHRIRWVAKDPEFGMVTLVLAVHMLNDTVGVTIWSVKK